MNARVGEDFRVGEEIENLRLQTLARLTTSAIRCDPGDKGAVKINRRGQGSPAVILIHGGPSLFGYMESLGRLLEADFEIIDYAQRGTFENLGPGEALGLDDLIEELMEIARTLQNRVVLLGHSWGAVLALLFASKYPRVAEKLVLLGTGVMDKEIGNRFSVTLDLRLSAEQRREVKQLEDTYKTAKDPETKIAAQQRRLDLYTPLYNLDPGSTKDLTPARWNFETFRIVNSQVWELIENGKIRGILERVETPVIAFHGTHDPIPHDLTSRLLAKSLKNIRFRAIDQAGHFIWLESAVRNLFLAELKDAIRTP